MNNKDRMTSWHGRVMFLNAALERQITRIDREKRGELCLVHVTRILSLCHTTH